MLKITDKETKRLTMVCIAREGTDITNPTKSPPLDLAHTHAHNTSLFQVAKK